jgi:DNA-binding IscR family transcriptional regulator
VQLLEGELGADAEANGAVWSEAVDAVKSVLSATTIADVADREAHAAGAQMYYI